MVKIIALMKENFTCVTALNFDCASYHKITWA